ncbi:hypothetical protein PCANC_07948 [Puccinia coronata f. sp. avenae]|uniref:Uncharacterized protein n=1 Tax=Puccinia coronata f. sp. avenae TaxID=200324 RepID=A0A2N5UYI7_9BASI|nr:hypothetical protein PCANC_07948 [Puccinia coronata f. sp. avenae]
MSVRPGRLRHHTPRSLWSPPEVFPQSPSCFAPGWQSHSPWRLVALALARPKPPILSCTSPSDDPSRHDTPPIPPQRNTSPHSNCNVNIAAPPLTCFSRFPSQHPPTTASIQCLPSQPATNPITSAVSGDIHHHPPRLSASTNMIPTHMI